MGAFDGGPVDDMGHHRGARLFQLIPGSGHRPGVSAFGHDEHRPVGMSGQ